MKFTADIDIVKCDVKDVSNSNIILSNVVAEINLQTIRIAEQKPYGVQPMLQSGGMFLIPELTVTRGEKLPYAAAREVKNIMERRDDNARTSR